MAQMRNHHPKLHWILDVDGDIGWLVVIISESDTPLMLHPPVANHQLRYVKKDKTCIEDVTKLQDV